MTTAIHPIKTLAALAALAVLGAVLAQLAASQTETQPASRPQTAPAAQSQPASFRVAAIQFVSEFGNPQANVKRLTPLIRQAAAHGAKVVVLPETAVTGYMSFDLTTTWQADGRQATAGLKGVSPGEAAEPTDGPSVRALAALAGQLGVYLTVPFVEVDPKSGRYFNTIILAGPDGKCLLHYRKLNPWPYAETGWATKGDRGHQYIDTPFGRLGLLVCYDINFEPPALKAARVDTLLYCIAWVDAADSKWYAENLPAIARANGLNIVGANWTVPDKPEWHGYGQSEIIARDGRVLAKAGSDLAEEIIYADLPVGG
jgi:predicted amidohydrolase